MIAIEQIDPRMLKLSKSLDCLYLVLRAIRLKFYFPIKSIIAVG